MFAWIVARARQLRRDVWDDPEIGPVSGLLLTALTALVVWLTLEYAPSAHIRAELAPANWDQGSISPETGQKTVAIMIFATLAAGFEPILVRRFNAWWFSAGKRSYFGLPVYVRWCLYALVLFIRVGAKIASTVWSLADYLLARPAAFIVGASWRGWRKRYAHFVSVMIIVVAVAYQAPPGAALWAIGGGLVAVLAIVRRWAWIEADRETFLVERGQRQTGGGAIRIGFQEDLRDEALFALTCSFLLIPIGLDLAQQVTCEMRACAFGFTGQSEMPRAPIDRFIVWLGYFGAELAKTIPFVDWSEVFHVANGSPIDPQTALGSQIAFTLRAGLDLMFLAALLQAVQVATRLREQSVAFRSNRLPILEPFAERSELLRLARSLAPLDIRATEQPALLDFPP